MFHKKHNNYLGSAHGTLHTLVSNSVAKQIIVFMLLLINFVVIGAEINAERLKEHGFVLDNGLYVREKSKCHDVAKALAVDIRDFRDTSIIHFGRLFHARAGSVDIFFELGPEVETLSDQSIVNATVNLKRGQPGELPVDKLLKLGFVAVDSNFEDAKEYVCPKIELDLLLRLLDIKSTGFCLDKPAFPDDRVYTFQYEQYTIVVAVLDEDPVLKQTSTAHVRIVPVMISTKDHETRVKLESLGFMQDDEGRYFVRRGANVETILKALKISQKSISKAVNAEFDYEAAVGSMMLNLKTNGVKNPEIALDQVVDAFVELYPLNEPNRQVKLSGKELLDAGFEKVKDDVFRKKRITRREFSVLLKRNICDFKPGPPRVTTAGVTIQGGSGKIGNITYELILWPGTYSLSDPSATLYYVNVNVNPAESTLPSKKE